MQWLNKNIVALGMVSLLSDCSQEMATAVLPSFLLSLGGSAALLGIIEGVADAAVSFSKLFAGWYSDILGKRKPFALIGYALSVVGVGMLALSYHWYQVLVGRLIVWTGKGMRKPPRDALLVESTQPAFYGRVFGFHRGMDTVGAIIGPLVVYFLIPFVSWRVILLLALIPGILAVVLMMTVQEQVVPTIDARRSVSFELRHLPTNFLMLTTAFTLFALGKFADSMLILRITQLLAPLYGTASAVSGALLYYTMRNVFYAAGSYPIGALADVVGKRKVLAIGYCCAALVAFGLGYEQLTTTHLFLLCSLAGISLAITDATEKSVAAEVIPAHIRGTSYGLIALLASFAALLSSALIGFLWTYYSARVAFSYSALLSFLAAILLITIRRWYPTSRSDVA